MEKSRKTLKFLSEIILIFLTFSIIRTILEVFLVKINIDGVPNSAIIVAKIILCVLYLVIFAPQIYVGVKGIKVSNKPDSSRAHITWAVIFIVFSVLATVSAVVDIINVVDVAENIFVLIDSVIDFVLYFFYVKAAKQVLAAA